jgi:LmbE family N-acetylglucosaminyl deacetylase
MKLMPSIWQRFLKILKRLVPFLLIFLLGGGSAYDQSLATGHLSLENLPEISLEGVHSLMVIAPHPDDETLGPGGLIQAALAHKINVHIVVVTNGDGQEIAPAAMGMDLIPKTSDFVAIGKRRQAESITALEKLGLTASDVSYLSYPDRGIKPIWLASWNTECPYYSSYTKTTHSPYPNTYDAHATYCGSDVLYDLQAIITAQKPDLLVMPHPDDQHPDHLAVSNFTRLAVALVSQADSTYHPSLLGYLVHFGYYPEPRGDHPDKSLLPPVPLMGVNYSWVRLDLTPQEEQIKITAVEDYSSQIHLMRDFLVSFDRPNELFM